MHFRGPAHVDFNLTNGCNLACSHCHSSSGPKLDNEMNTEEILNTIKQLHEIGTLKIAFAGGEPFIRKDIVQILSYACSLPGWQIAVISNGFFFSPKMVRKLEEECPNLSINISLDGSNPQRYGILRKQLYRPDADPTPLFEKVIEGIRTVVQSKLKVSINFTLTKATIDDVLPTYKLIDELGAEAMVAIKFFPGGYGKQHLDIYEIPYSMWNERFAELTRLKLTGAIPKMQISVPSPWEFYLPLIEGEIDLVAAEMAWNYRSPLREKVYSRMRSIGDVAGVAELSISSNGKVYPSILLTGERQMECGDLRKMSLKDIWEKSPVLKFPESVMVGNQL
ncbi:MULTISPECIES: radical SAM protein [unclassified Geobacillus]|uniref:radical SAM protein n=1 Tax=unclassified Geobacillus TaxID=2642459 RepID=UPI000BE34A77|nr:MULTISPECIES: radical SAM protein [unclassified Geobacillus]PDM38794.1 coenzyme PQQ synthesis protein [Parageobacillus yumthangensis]RDV23372.1 radical SAM protein [Parageobacillus toebii]TXK89593.1 radical SAM protein [Parageobacillus sp. SY1]PUF85680.1 radical SAM protein [Geobacillus sp. LYN3]TXK86302.1 radical SAM protein [Geobacillus sp. AYS3]